MAHTARACIATIALACVAAAATAQDDKLLRITPEEVKWPQGASAQTGTSGARGIQMQVLYGNLKQTGLYTMMLRVPPNTKIQAHSHPDDRIATVIAGTWYFGYGDEFDEAKLKALPAGSFYTEPPGQNHFAMTKDEEVVVQLTGTGPTGTKYVNPDHDPTKKQ